MIQNLSQAIPRRIPLNNVARLLELTAVALKMTNVGPVSIDEESDSESFVSFRDCGIGIRVDTSVVTMTGGVPRIGSTYTVVVSTLDAGSLTDPPSEDEREIETFHRMDAAVAELFATITRTEAECALEASSDAERVNR